MSYQGYLEEMMRPLRVYQTGGVFQQGEFRAVGESLDFLAEQLEEIEREMSLLTAEDWGIEQISDLFTIQPSAITTEERKNALIALRQISGDSFTLEALNTTLAGCGTLAKVSETEELAVVEISFPNIPGVPGDFENITGILEDILPAHLQVRYCFWLLTWQMLEEKISSFGQLDSLALSWEDLESLVL